MSNKRLSVLLSAIMVLSMVAVGITALAGSAAAQASESGDVYVGNDVGLQGSLSDQNGANHIITVDITSSGAAGTTVNANSSAVAAKGEGDINITYTGEDGAFDAGAMGATGAVTVEKVDSTGSVTAVSTSNNYQARSDGSIDINIDSTISLSAGDTVRIKLDGIDHTASVNNGDNSVQVEFTDNSDQTSNVVASDLTLSLPGDIDLKDKDGGETEQTYHSFTSAVNNASSGEEVVLPSGTINQFERGDAASGSLASAQVSAANVDIVGQGTDSTTVVLGDSADGSNSGNLLELSTGSEGSLTVKDVALEGDGRVSQVNNVIDTSGGTSTGTTIDTVDLFNATGSAVNTATSNDLTVDTVFTDDFDSASDYDAVSIGTAADTATTVGVTEVTANNLSAGTGVSIGSAGDADLDVFINNTDVELNGAGTGFDLQVDSGVSDNTQRVFATDNTVDEVTNNKQGIGYDLKTNAGGTEAEGDVDKTINGTNTDINGTNKGVTITNTYRGDSVTVHNATFENIGDTAIELDSTSGANGVAANIEDIDVLNSLGAKGIHVDDNGINLNLDTSYNSNINSQIDDVATGVDLDTINSLSDISNTSFDNIATTGIDIGADGGTALTLEDITVNGQNSVTAINDDTGNDLTVKESQLGSTGTAVGAGVDVDSTSGHDTNVEDTEIGLSSGTGILADDNGYGGNGIDVADVTIDGDSSSTAIKLDDDSGTTNATTLKLDTADDESSTIGPIGTGVDISNGDINDVKNTTFEDVENEAITVTDTPDATVNFGSIDVNANNNNVGAGTGIDYSVATTGANVKRSSINADTGIRYDANADSTITRNTITASNRGIDVQDVGTSGPSLTANLNHIDAGDASATGVYLADDGDGEVDLKHNDITGFTASDGYGLKGQVGGDINDGTANWWGSANGPQNSSDGSTVQLSTAESQDGTAKAYDPFLTVPVDAAHESGTSNDLVSETADFEDKGDIQDSDITLFAQDLEVRSGQSLAFPITSAHTISEAHQSFSGTVYGWNHTGQYFEQVTSETPAGLDAYVVQFDESATGDSTMFRLEYASDSNGQAPVRGKFTYKEGLNVVSPATYTTGASGSINTVDTFGYAEDGSGVSGISTLASWQGPNLARHSAPTYPKQSVDSGTADLSPYRAYTIDIESTTSAFSQELSAKLSPGATLQDVKDDIDQS